MIHYSRYTDLPLMNSKRSARMVRFMMSSLQLRL